MVTDSVKSLVDKMALPKDSIEILYRVDTDDKLTLDVLPGLMDLVPSKAVLAPRGRGYAGLHTYINELAKIATGDWLFVWNDDALMLTDGWDKILSEINPTPQMGFRGSGDVCLVAPRVIQREISWEFPILRRKTFEVLGHFSNAYSSDAYIYWVMSRLRAAVFIERIRVTHIQNEIDDVTKREGRDASNAYMNEVLGSKEMKAMQEADRKVLENYMRSAK
jgi:hypothetical protein